MIIVIVTIIEIADEQRAESLNADDRESGDVLRICESSDFKIITPLFVLDELIYILATNLFKKFYKLDRHNKGNNTLIRHVIKCLYGVIYKHYNKIYNTFSVSTLKILGMNGRMDGQEKAIKYQLSKKKIHSARFSTDAFSGYYYEKTRYSKYGIIDIPEYSGGVATFDELNLQHSYFVDSVSKSFLKDK